MFFCGADISGLYTAASKLPAMINLVTSIFQQAWQYSAAKEINSKDGKVFFSNVFRVYTYVSILLCIILVVNNRFICSFLLKSQFYHAWKFVPMLLLAATFGCFSSYFGSFYGALKNNVAAMLSTLVGAIINVILNLILIPMCGGVGGAIATAVSYGVISLIRFFDLKRRVSININYLRITIQFIVLIVVVLFAMTELYTLTFIIGISGILIVIVTDFDLLKRSFSKVLSVICKLL